MESRLSLVFLLYVGLCCGYQPRWDNWKKGPGAKVPQAATRNKHASCGQYRLPDLSEMSEPLRLALARYETFHAESLLNENPTRALHRYVQSPKDVQSKYLVVSVRSSYDGIGNRLLPLVSSFLLAMLTERILLVDFDDYDVQDVLCGPVRWAFTGHWPKIRSTVRNDIPTLSEVEPTELHKIVTMPLSHKSDLSHFKVIQSVDFSRLLEKVQILHVQSNQYFLPLLFVNPLFKGILGQWFPERVSTPLFRYLIRPTDQIWYKVRFYDCQHCLGLQYRSFTPKLDNDLLHKSLHCLDAQMHGAPMGIYIASLHGEISQKIGQGREWDIWHPNQEEHQVAGWEQAASALQDIIALSRAKGGLVRTAKSTLGYVAATLRGGNSFVISPLEPECITVQHAEPCLHRADYNIASTDERILEPCDDAKGIRLKYFNRK